MPAKTIPAFLKKNPEIELPLPGVTGWLLQGERQQAVAVEFAETVEITWMTEPASVTLLRTGEALDSSFSDGILKIDLPAAVRTDLDDVVAVRW